MDLIYEIGDSLGFDLRYFVQYISINIHVFLLFVCDYIYQHIIPFSSRILDIIDYLFFTFRYCFFGFCFYFVDLPLVEFIFVMIIKIKERKKEIKNGSQL